MIALFYHLSFFEHDDLMRVFASDTIKNMMGRFGIPEEEAIDSKLVSRSLENAQAKIEGLHFDSRKDVLQYDDVLNFQRHFIYNIRRDLLCNNIPYNLITRLGEAFSDEHSGFEKYAW